MTPFGDVKEFGSEDSLYEGEEIQAMRNIDYSEADFDACGFRDAVEADLAQDIEAKNKDYLMRERMNPLFADMSIYDLSGPENTELSFDTTTIDGRMMFVKHMILKIVESNTEYKADCVEYENIDTTSPNFGVNEGLAVHYFQAKRNTIDGKTIEGKSNADAIIGPLTMQDMIHASGILKPDIEEEKKPFEEGSIFADWREDLFGRQPETITVQDLPDAQKAIVATIASSPDSLVIQSDIALLVETKNGYKFVELATDDASNIDITNATSTFDTDNINHSDTTTANADNIDLTGATSTIDPTITNANNINPTGTTSIVETTDTDENQDDFVPLDEANESLQDDIKTSLQSMKIEDIYTTSTLKYLKLNPDATLSVSKNCEDCVTFSLPLENENIEFSKINYSKFVHGDTWEIDKKRLGEIIAPEIDKREKDLSNNVAIEKKKEAYTGFVDNINNTPRDLATLFPESATSSKKKRYELFFKASTGEENTLAFDTILNNTSAGVNHPDNWTASITLNMNSKSYKKTLKINLKDFATDELAFDEDKRNKHFHDELEKVILA